MIDAGSVEFAHARIWARWGARPSEALWQRIETTRELAGVLELARGSSLARWLQGLEARVAPHEPPGPHAIEYALRGAWRARVAEVAAWMPPAWAAALRWCIWLAELPLVQALARGAPAPAWAAADAALRVLLTPAAERAALRGDAADACALLDAARAAPEHTLAAWLAAWRARLPAQAGRGMLLHELLPLVQAHAAALAAPALVDAWALRQALQARLALLLRRCVVEPGAAFVYLALAALELERLRGELVRRAAFAQRGPSP